MNLLTNLFRGLRSLFGKRRVDRELDEELAAFVEASAADKQRHGMSREAAQRAARVEVGSAGAVKHQVWSSRWESVPDNFFQDIRFALRQLIKSPGFTTIAILSLMLGIGANTAIFTLLNVILLRPLPVQNPKELLLFGDGRASGSTGSIPDGSWRLFSYSFYRDFRAKDVSFSGVAAISSSQFHTKASIAGGAYQTTQVDLVSGSFFNVLGVPAFLGRTIGESDDATAGAAPVAVASYTWFQRHFNGDTAALGKVIRIQSHDYTLVGVARPGFTGISVGQPADLWIPLSMEKEISPGWNGLDNKFFQSLYLIGRLKPGVTAAQASSETNVLFKQIVRSYMGAQPSAQHLDDLAHASVELTPGAHGVSRLRGKFSSPLMILMAIVALVLLIACANIANMLLARGVNRTREVAVRMAVGATRRRIVVQLLTESLLLALLGAAAGMALAWKASALLLHMATPGPEPIPLDVHPDLAVLAYTLGVTVITALLFGMLPAFRATGLEFTPALKDGRGSSSVSTRGALARSLIVGQVALSVLLLVVAGLFVRSLINLASIDTGFDKHNALVFSLDSSTANLPHKTPDEIRSVRLQEQIESRVQTIPGVQADSFAFFTFNQGGWSDQVLFQGVTRTPHNGEDVFFNNVGNGFFSAMGIPLVAGRTFTANDTQTSPKVAVINETMARRFFPDGWAIGKRFAIGEAPDHPGEIEVIGIVKDAKYTALNEGTLMGAYFPCTQQVGFYGNFVVRYAPGANRSEIISRTRAAVAQINPNILLNSVTSLEEQVDGSIATQSLIARLSSFFGIVAVFLACIGIYGLLSYSVARRTSELGIRVALGARSGALLWMILRESLLLLALGLTVGASVAVGSTRILKSLLYELSPLDPMAMAISIAVVAVMTLAAAWLPAHRATRIEPMQALRTE
ncbi:ABC transporter permease [Occallatibacter riparius]|uniref:ABC transporter permease n=1 Tax=Occallatibacter riparius TaxID=1002689 RepID=A0A9J7BKT6_9BACT|nr:ABC transporter permease [Occallatibacter riparius]UWZ82386.1 ABC transporter permease [Occallatibacter riparius]